jgi:Methionine biosynthesis protein MetW
MTSYERFGEFYDAVMGDRRAAAEQVVELIRAAKPDAKNVLELGCGTGSILKCLQDAYEVSGAGYFGEDAFRCTQESTSIKTLPAGYGRLSNRWPIRRDCLCIRFD